MKTNYGTTQWRSEFSKLNLKNTPQLYGIPTVNDRSNDFPKVPLILRNNTTIFVVIITVIIDCHGHWTYRQSAKAFYKDRFICLSLHNTVLYGRAVKRCYHKQWSGNKRGKDLKRAPKSTTLFNQGHQPLTDWLLKTSVIFEPQKPQTMRFCSCSCYIIGRVAIFTSEAMCSQTDTICW